MPFDGQEFTNDTIRALEKARAYMDEHGWCRGREQNDRGEVCLGGAVLFGNGVLQLPIGVKIILAKVSLRRTGNPRFAPILNDRVLTSKAEALAVFDEAIALERQKLMETVHAL